MVQKRICVTLSVLHSSVLHSRSCYGQKGHIWSHEHIVSLSRVLTLIKSNKHFLGRSVMFTVGFFPPHPLAPQSYLHPFCLHCPLPGPQCPRQSCPVPTRHTQGCCFLGVPSTELVLSPWVPWPGDTCVTRTPSSAPSRTLCAQKMSFLLLYLGYIWISEFPCIFKKWRVLRFGNSSRGR